MFSQAISGARPWMVVVFTRTVHDAQVIGGYYQSVTVMPIWMVDPKCMFARMVCAQSLS